MTGGTVSKRIRAHRRAIVIVVRVAASTSLQSNRLIRRQRTVDSESDAIASRPTAREAFNPPHPAVDVVQSVGCARYKDLGPRTYA